MKKIIASLLAVCTIMSLSVFLSSCDWFDEEEISTVKILDTPAQKDFLSLLNNGISGIISDPPELTYSSSVDIGGIEAKHPEGSTSDYDLATFDSAADYVKKLMLKSKPFNVDSITVTKGMALKEGITVGEKSFDSTDLYPSEIAPADFSKITDSEATARNWANENATDAEGKTITNSDGEVETVTYLADNNLLLNIRFNDVIEEKDENGEIINSTAVAPDVAVIEKYFGKPTDAAEITAELNKTSDYLLFGDYTYEYSDCSLLAVIDLTTGHIISLSYSKSMNITLPVKGVGTFAAIGDAVLIMRTTETTSFGVNYAEEAASGQTTSTEAPTTAANTTGDTISVITQQTTIKNEAESATDEKENVSDTAPAADTTAA